MKCERCSDERTKIFTMSYFNTDTICSLCKKEEEKHPLYERAKKIEHNECLKGNYNFEGIFSGLHWNEIKGIKGTNTRN